MARLFMVPVSHDGLTHWATIVNYPASPSTFEVRFFKESGLTDLPPIIFEKRNGKLELSNDSPLLEEGFIKAVVKALETHGVEKSLNL